MTAFALNDQPTPLRDEQRAMAQAIGQLLGASPAVWYRDACRLVGPPVDGRLESVAYLVPTLLKQVEQKFRGVLLPIEFVPLVDRDVWTQEIDEIAATYRLPPEDRERWLRTLEQIDQAHDEAGDGRARAPMLGAIFSECEKLFAMLLDLLGRSYVDVLRRINTLPAKPDAKALRTLLDRLPESAVVENRLLEKLPRDILYLEALRRAGFFRRPPSPLRDERGQIQAHPPWIALLYLADFAPNYPREVGPILLDIPPTENLSVHAKMAELASKLPPPIAAEWARRETDWLKDHQDKPSNLIGHLSELGVMLVEHGVVDVGQALLKAVLVYPKQPAADSAHQLPGLNSFLVQKSQRLINANPVVALEVLATLIQSAVDLRAHFYGEPIDRSLKADSRWPDQSMQRRLIDAVRTAAEQLTSSEPLEAAVLRLESYPGPFFRRLALHILRRSPSGADSLIQKRLVDEASFYLRELDPEYSLLLGEQLGRLTKPQQQLVLGWIQKGPTARALASFGDDEVGRLEKTRFIEGWTYRQLRMLEPSISILPSSLRARYEDLRRDFAPKSVPAPVRTKSAEELLALDQQALKEYLRSWAPGPDEMRTWRLEQPDTLRQAVATAPERFINKVGYFLQVNSRLQDALLSGLEEAIRTGRGSVTKDILLLTQDLLRETPSQAPLDSAQQAWSSTHLSAARLLKAAVVRKERPLLSLADFDLLFELLRQLLSLPPDSIRSETLKLTPDSRAAEISSRLLDSPRGIGFEVLLWACVWLQRERPEHQTDKPSQRLPSSAQSLLKRLLSEHDPIIHGAFGEQIFTLLSLDEQWTIANVAQIFPIKSEDHELFSSAWEMYLVYGRGYPGDERFAIVRFAYDHAVYLLSEQKMDNETADGNPPLKALAQHLGGLYLTDLLDLSPGSLLVRFLERASDSLRAALLRFTAEILNRPVQEEEDTARAAAERAEEMKRAIRLWSYRYESFSRQPGSRREEAGAFAVFFTNENIDPSWALQQLERILPFAIFDHFEANRLQERLAALAPEYPVECMRCLDGYLQLARLLIHIEAKAAKVVFAEALKSSDKVTVSTARAWVNRLVASGVSEENLASLVEPLPAAEEPPSSAVLTASYAEHQGSAPISRLVVKGFKSLADLDLELGLFNVFIGANGSGKTNLLESLGVLGAAVGGSVSPEHLAARGVRITKPVLFKSSFASQDLRRVITLAAHGVDHTLYQLGLENPVEHSDGSWRVFSERLETGDSQMKILRRNPRASLIFDAVGNRRRIDNPNATVTYAASAAKDNPEAKGAQETLDALTRYAIFSLNTQVLRGLSSDRERLPLGLSGGGLPGALRDVLAKKQLGAFELEDVLPLLGWAAEISVVPSDQAVLSSAVHAGPLVVQFRDRYMKRGRDLLSGYDANEGALYVLFYLVLACHPQAPRLCAIDDFDHCLNPLLACRLTETLTKYFVSDGSRQWVLTTHNPLVLDGLDLSDARIRLFAVDRDDAGMTHVKRVVVDSEMLTKHEEGYALSNLWIMGRLGGLPKNL